MRKFTINVAALSTLSLAIVLASCSSPMPVDESVAIVETSDGAAIVDTISTEGTVVALDASKRKVTVKDLNGKKHTFKAGPDVINYDQIRVGDNVSATLTEEVVVALRQPGTSTSAAAGTAVALAPKGAKPGAVMADVAEVTAKITAIDTKKRSVTLEFVDGTSRTMRVGTRADLSSVHVGESITMQVSECLAVIVEKP